MASDREFVVGLVCDNQLLVKATKPGRAKIGVPLEAPPFPGASKGFLMADLDDPEFLAELIRTTADALARRVGPRRWGQKWSRLLTAAVSVRLPKML